ncbi:unnamed protein product [Leuciscus chuanchicus]
MDRAKIKLKVIYREKLNKEAKERYLEKIKAIDGLDPAYTFEQFRNYKSLEAHHHFTNGWVQDLEIYKLNDQKIVVHTKVLHSQRLNEPPLKPWVILNTSGQVECASMAGIAESCTHVGALLFKIEVAVRIRDTKTVTDVPAYWMMPSSVDKVQAEVGYKIDLSSGAAKKGKAVCLSGMEGYYQNYADPVKPCVVLKSLQHLRDLGKDGCELSVLQQHCEGLTHMVAVTEAEVVAVEAQTRQQHRSPAWYTSRAGRITASNIHAVVSTSVARPALSTVRRVCYPKKTASTAAIRWGIDHEEEARQTYVTLTGSQHDNLKVEQCGFIINPSFPEVGASPDGLIHCTCCGKGCLEIKCTYKHQNNSIQQACTDDSNFCLQLTDGKLNLKTHKNYSQAQTQIFVTGSGFCDFVVWTQRDCTSDFVLPLNFSSLLYSV